MRTDEHHETQPKQKPQHELLHHMHSTEEPEAESDPCPVFCSTKDQEGRMPKSFMPVQIQPTKYYRIVYRGVVGLLKEPKVDSAKSGAYISYGEIVASSHELELSTMKDCAVSHTIKTEYQQRKQTSSDTSNSVLFDSSSASTASTAPPTRSSLPLAPTQHHATNDYVTRARGDYLIRVDEVLTGGYAIDAEVSTSRNQATPRRNNFSTKNCSTKKPTDESSMHSESVDHHGYLFLRQNGVAIAECIPSPPLLCQPGAFFYRVVSSSPLPIIAGPCADAPVTRSVALPGTVHEISLRMGSLVHGSINANGLEDGVVYLRLSHRKGWIADRRFTVSAKHGVNTRKQNAERQQLEIVMKDISEYVDVTNFSIRDDESVGGTSISSVSFVTPASVIRLRKTTRIRNGRTGSVSTRTRGNRSGMIVHQQSRNPGKRQNQMKMKKPEQTDVPSPISDVSLFSETSSMKNHKQRANIFLMRVIAPYGLKILDAPHFQVNNLIRGKMVSVPSSESYSGTLRNNTTASNHRSKAHHLGSVQKSYCRVCSWEFDATGKTRFLPHGALFEASKRVERAGTYTPGSFLIKLADGTGWAIVPKEEELALQYQAFHGLGTRKEEYSNRLKTHEEVGNAMILNDQRSSRSKKERHRWVRVVQQTGILVSCAPTIDDESISKTLPKSFSGTSQGLQELNSRGGYPPHDSDTASSVGTVLMDVFRPSSSDKHKQTPLSTAKSKYHHMNLMISCGMCLEIEQWEDSPNALNIDQHFVRLRGGQGWIPRIIQRNLCLVDVKPPSIRQGSFWYRVHTIQGVVVRTGPSGKASTIKSDTNISFRFECGEFLRASEVLAIDGTNEMNESLQDNDEMMRTKMKSSSECFAKLYRNKHSRRIHTLNSGAGSFLSLSTLTTPGEWVHVECNGVTYLEECTCPPTIQRHRDGWKYKVVSNSSVDVRRGPSFKAEKTATTISQGEVMLINERVTLNEEKMTWLRLKDGRGWVHDVDENGITLLVDAQELKIVKSAPTSNLLGRLFQSET